MGLFRALIGRAGVPDVNPGLLGRGLGSTMRKRGRMANYGQLRLTLTVSKDSRGKQMILVASWGF